MSNPTSTPSKVALRAAKKVIFIFSLLLGVFNIFPSQNQAQRSLLAFSSLKSEIREPRLLGEEID